MKTGLICNKNIKRDLDHYRDLIKVGDKVEFKYKGGKLKTSIISRFYGGGLVVEYNTTIYLPSNSYELLRVFNEKYSLRVYDESDELEKESIMNSYDNLSI